MASHNSSNANRLNGRPSDDYARSDVSDILHGLREIRGTGLSAGIKCYNPNGGRNYHVIQKDDGRMYITDETAATVLLGVDKDKVDFRNQTLWHEGNDGEGSGLDADTVRGQTPSDLASTPTFGTIPVPEHTIYSSTATASDGSQYDAASGGGTTQLLATLSVDMGDAPHLKVECEAQSDAGGGNLEIHVAGTPVLQTTAGATQWGTYYGTKVDMTDTRGTVTVEYYGGDGDSSWPTHIRNLAAYKAQNARDL